MRRNDKPARRKLSEGAGKLLSDDGPAYDDVGELA
jgi:hypothetical protein